MRHTYTGADVAEDLSESDDEIFPKSIIPSTKATKHYLKGVYEHKKLSAEF